MFHIAPRSVVAAATLLAALLCPDWGRAQCPDVCAAYDVRPWAFYDRWDDDHLQFDPGHPEWRGNEVFDQESFTDLNRDGYYDPGESFEDGNGNGRFDMEFYHPLLTGYVASRDIGTVHAFRLVKANDEVRLQRFVAARPAGTPAKTWSPQLYVEYIRKGFPDAAVGGGFSLELIPGDWRHHTQRAVLELLQSDPNAAWDPACQCVDFSDFGGQNASPRLLLIAFADPRSSPGGGYTITIKLAGGFLEEVTSPDEYGIRLVPIRVPPVDCGEGGFEWAGFVTHCP